MAKATVFVVLSVARSKVEVVGAFTDSITAVKELQRKCGTFDSLKGAGSCVFAGTDDAGLHWQMHKTEVTQP